ncbi:MAG: arsenate reductase ArsC [Deltaproteobacteria bacterium]
MNSEKTKNILFVCIENSCRSQMAEAFAKALCKGNIAAYSAGSRPSGAVNPDAVKVMAEAGYDLNGHGSKSIADIPDIEYDIAVTMGCGDECPFVKAKKRIDWNIPDPNGNTLEFFRAVRNLIEAKVKELLSTL